MAEAKDIDKAIKALRDNGSRYAKPTKYYAGDHDLAFATEKFLNAFGSLFREFALNLCPAVVDALRDKLIVTGFRVEEGGETIADEAWKIWQANRMGQRSGEIHKEAVKNGDAYAIVWVDPTGKTTIYPQKATSCTVVYDEESPGKILWAAKYWFTEERAIFDKFTTDRLASTSRVRLNLFYPDRIEKYISQKKTEGILPEAKEFVPLAEGDTVPNPYGVVPVFHFGNNADINSFGDSELSNAIPVQDGLNKSVLDMLVAMEFAAYRQRWASGIEIEYDDHGKPIPPYQAGIERLWISESETAKFGSFDQSDLEQFLKVKDGFRTDIATVTGTPLHYFMLTGASFPQSGISVEKLESRFLAKVRDRMESFGNVWEDVMSFALTIEKKGKDIRLFTEWEDPSPLSEKERLENLLLKKEIGVTDEQLLTEAGYGADEVTAMVEAKAQAREEMVRGFNRGEDLATEDTEL